MGLDTYASNTPDDIELTPEQARAFEEADFSLCGGVFSGGGGSFRGKVYARLILGITGEGLYQTWIPPERVQEMYRALAACDPHQVIEELDATNVTPEEVIGLQQFFQVCAEHGLGLVNWW